jgi:hypothetical protein
MSTQATTAAGGVMTTQIVREYRIQRTTAHPMRGLLARLRGARPAEAQWRWQPVPAAAVDLQVEMATAHQRLLFR